MVHYKTERLGNDMNFTPLLVSELKQYSVIKLYTNNRSEENKTCINIRLLCFMLAQGLLLNRHIAENS
jgi:hypothetical protein